MAQAEPILDRSVFRPHEHGGVEGVCTMRGVRFECFLPSAGQGGEQAWQIAERLVRLVLDRFAAIERRVRSDLAPDLDHWTAEEVSLAELTRRTTAAMRASKAVVLHVYSDYGEAMFDGPDFANGHGVCVTMGKGGRIASVSLA